MPQGDPHSPSVYRLFWTDGRGRIAGAPATLQAPNDARALEIATELALGRPAELWLGARLVAELNRPVPHE